MLSVSLPISRESAPPATVHHDISLNTPSTYTFKTLDSTSGNPTLCYGINDNRVVSALVQDPTTFDFTGTIFKNGAQRSFTVPGASDTEAYQINDAGRIAVSYFGPALIYHSAVYDSVRNTWTFLPDVPGARENLAGGINNKGLVVGDTFANATFQGGVGWTFQAGHYKFFTAPGNDAAKGGTATYSVNDQGQIVGYVYDNKGVEHAYVKTGSAYTLFDGPGATGTLAIGINDEGVVTGSYASKGVQHGFLWGNGVFTTLDFPGSTGTYITSVNNNGDLAGIYFDKTGDSHAFEALNIPVISGFKLIDGQTGAVLAQVRNGAVINLASYSASVRAHLDIEIVTAPAGIGVLAAASATFSYDGKYRGFDSTAPLTLLGAEHESGNALAVGAHTLVAQAFPGRFAQGFGSEFASISFKVIN